MAYLLVKIFFAAFFINLLYELLHSVLYTTCLRAPLKKYVSLIIKAAIFDGLAISIMYFFTLLFFYGNMAAFVVISLLFAYVWELYSLKKKKWEYVPAMPKILGVGVTPLVQLAFTGLLSLYIVFHLFV